MKVLPQKFVSGALRCMAAAALAQTALGPGSALANDRPFESARTAVPEDEEGGWSAETWVQRLGSTRVLAAEAEYAFSGRTSMQLEAGKAWTRGGLRDHEVELEFKHLFKLIGDDRWGWGVSLAASTSHGNGDDDGLEAARRAVTIKLPVSFQWGPPGTYVHLNAGMIRPQGERRVWTRSVAAQTDLRRPHTTLFGEWARDGSVAFTQMGVRHWLDAHQKLALDVALQRRTAETRASGFALGLGWYDF